MIGAHGFNSFLLGHTVQNLIEICIHEKSVSRTRFSFFRKFKPRKQSLDLDVMKTILSMIRVYSFSLGLSAVQSQLDRIDNIIISSYELTKLESLFVDLKNRMEDDLKRKKFIYITPDLIRFYSEEDLFGAEVGSKFPLNAEDIESAGKCLALGQPTAAVFHLMRAMEAAVSQLSSSLQIPNPDREWGKLLSDIHRKIESMPKTTDDERVTRNNWSESHANLYHVKQAWRNDTMHPKKTYTTEQATEVFEATRVFMRHLAFLI